MQQASSAAAKIPEELFEGILWHVWNSKGEDYTRRLSISSLVCKYWARQCRQMLFHWITLRTPDNAKRFYEMLRRPALPGLQPIAALIRDLKIEAQNMDEPWFHLVFMIIPKLQSVRWVYLQPCPPGGKWLWCSLHPFLPRSFPGSLMPIRWLYFEGVHVHSRSTLIRLLSTIPLTEDLKVLNTTYDIAEDFDTSPLCDLRQRKLVVYMDDPQLCLAFIPSIANARFSPAHTRLRSRSILHAEDLSTLRDLFTIFAGALRFELKIEAKASDEAGVALGLGGGINLRVDAKACSGAGESRA